jgi:hypothetical protein
LKSPEFDLIRGKALIFSSMDTNKKASRRGGCTNQIPLTIKPYPMPPSYGIIEYTSTFYWIKLKTKSISIF